MAKQQKPEAADSPGFVTKTTVGSSDVAAANQRRDDIRSGREDVQGIHYAGDKNSVKERYQRNLERLDATIGRAQAEKRQLLSALVALEQGLGMGQDAAEIAAEEPKPEPVSDPIPAPAEEVSDEPKDELDNHKP